MPTEKLVDGTFLSKLLANSYEAAMGGVEEAVAEHTQLFGADSPEKVQVVGTYTDHAIVANRDGEFYRCEWKFDEDGDVVLQNVRQIDVPVYEAEIRQSTIRKSYEEAVDAILECREDEAEEKLKELLDLATSGVPMTAEAVEHLFIENRERFAQADWVEAVRLRESEMRTYLGAEYLRIAHPRTKFSSLIGDGIEESVAEGRRSEILESIKELHEFLTGLRTRITLARQVNEGYRVRGGSTEDADGTADFIQFVGGFAEDLDGMISIVEDAQSVAEDGCAKCLARLHDGIAGQMREWAIAAVFAEKLARKFEAPKAA